MADKKEKDLSAITTFSGSHIIRVLTDAGVSVKATFANVAKWIIESYASSSLAGSNQSVKSAIDSLNSNHSVISKIELTLGLTHNALRITPTYEGTQEFLVFGSTNAYKTILVFGYYNKGSGIPSFTSLGTYDVTWSVDSNNSLILKLDNYASVAILTTNKVSISRLSI